MCSEVGLELHMNVAGCVIDEDTTTHIHVLHGTFAKRVEKSSVSGADEVIHGYALAG